MSPPPSSTTDPFTKRFSRPITFTSLFSKAEKECDGNGTDDEEDETDG